MPHECTNCGRVFADGSKQMLSGCPDCGGNKFQFKPASATETPESDSTPDTGSGITTADPTPDTAENTTHEGTTSADKSKRDLSPESREWPDHGYGSADSEAADPGSTEPEVPTSDSTVAPSTRADDASTPAADDASTPTADPEDAAAADTDIGSTTDDSIEDPAQASARSDVVSPDEIASGAPSDTAPPEATGASAPSHGDADGPPADADGRVIEPTSDDRPDLADLREELNEQFESIRIVAPGEYELNLMELYDRTEYIISLQEDGRYVIEVPDTWDTTPDSDET